MDIRGSLVGTVGIVMTLVAVFVFAYASSAVA